MSDERFPILDSALARGAGQLRLVEGTRENPTKASCAYPEHRESDWLSADGCRLVCGICHPKAAA